MSADRIAVNFGGMHTAAGDLSKRMKLIEAERDAVGRFVRTLLGSWNENGDSDAKAECEIAWTKLNGHIANMAMLIGKLGATTGDNADNQFAMEKRNQALFS